MIDVGLLASIIMVLYIDIVVGRHIHPCSSTNGQ